MDVTEAEHQFVERARVAHLATADAEGRPNVVPVCFAWTDGGIVSALDEKPKTVEPRDLRRVRDVAANPFVALVVDRYVEDWSRLGWVQLRGRAAVVEAGASGHDEAVTALREKYPQYRAGSRDERRNQSPEGDRVRVADEGTSHATDEQASHALDERPLLAIEPGHVVSWGTVDPD